MLGNEPVDLGNDPGSGDVAAQPAATSQIEIWRSVTGVSEDDFSLLATLAESNPPNAGGENFPNSPVIPYQLYIYKARRVDTASGAASAFSSLVYARAPWPVLTTFTRNPDMSTTTQNTNTGIRSKMGFGLETTENQPVKAQVLLDRASGSPNMELEQITRKTLRNNVGLAGGLAGKATVAGTGINVEPCPESITGLLCAFLGTPVSTVTAPVAASAGPPVVNAAPGYTDHVWSDSFDQFTGTMSERRGTSFFCFPGTRILGINIKADPDSSETVMFGLDTVHLNQLMYFQESDLGLDTAAFDTLLPPSPEDALLRIAGALSADSKTCDLKLKRGQKLRRGLVGQRGGTSHFLGRSEHSGDVDLYFSTEAELQRYLGQAQQAQVQGNYPYGATNTIQYVPLSLLLPMPPNAAGFQNQIEIIFPACSYKTVGQPVEGEQEIIQKISVQPYIDPATNTDLQIRVRNSKSLAAVTAFGVPLAAVPVNAVTAFHNP